MMRILIPVDDLPYSMAALHSVRQRNWPDSTKILLCRVMEECQGYVHPEHVFDSEAHSQALMVERQAGIAAAKQWLEELAAEVRESFSDVDIELLSGDIVQQLCLVAQHWSANYIVMGSHDRLASERRWLSSIAADVSDSSGCSIEIVRPGGLQSLMAEERSNWDSIGELDFAPRRILLAVDRSENSIASVKWLCRIGGHPATKIALITVLERSRTSEIPDLKHRYDPRADRPTPIAYRASLNERLEQIAEYINEHIDVEIEKQEVLEGSPARAILDYARHWNADSIVIGSRGDTNRHPPVVGSVARGVIEGAHCSIFAINNGETYKSICFDWLPRYSLQAQY